MTVVVVSNRVARATTDEPIAGGLAAALLPAVETYGAIWVGSSGRLVETPPKNPLLAVEALGNGALATVDFPAAMYRGFYQGFANSALWPALHSRPDLIRVTQEDYRCYREANAYMARALTRFSQPDTLFWVQDYHFLTLGYELRRLGYGQPIGFFLHTPWPPVPVILGLPHHRALIEGMLSYDLLGFQTDEDRHNFAEYLRREMNMNIDSDAVTCRAARLNTFPIGIDVEKFATRAAKSINSQEVTRLRASLQGAKLAIGVDRVDYSKGLANRVRAFGRMWESRPDLKREVSLLQIAVPSRCQIQAYDELQTELATLVGEINGKYGEIDWIPIRYINRGYSQQTLAGFYRAAQVGVVTPLHDGMNLVAKEYVAAQNPADPGVLVLSEFAGAAKELDAAILVNPHDVDSMAREIARAMRLSSEERQERWRAMMAKLKAKSVHAWFADFVDALSSTRSRGQPQRLWRGPSRAARSDLDASSKVMAQALLPG